MELQAISEQYDIVQAPFSRRRTVGHVVLQFRDKIMLYRMDDVAQVTFALAIACSALQTRDKKCMFETLLMNAVN